MKNITPLTVQAIMLLQNHIKNLGFTPVIHFELEGCYQLDTKIKKFSLNYQRINLQLENAGIDGELVPEYWSNQWEYVSLFNGQSPLKEAENLKQALALLPHLFAEQGVNKTLIKPVVWAGDKGKLANGSGDIFTTETRAVHIPNAVQMNIRAIDCEGHNVIIDRGFGEYLQQCFLETGWENVHTCMHTQKRRGHAVKGWGGRGLTTANSAPHRHKLASRKKRE